MPLDASLNFFVRAALKKCDSSQSKSLWTWNGVLELLTVTKTTGAFWNLKEVKMSHFSFLTHCEMPYNLLRLIAILTLHSNGRLYQNLDELKTAYNRKAIQCSVDYPRLSNPSKEADRPAVPALRPLVMESELDRKFILGIKIKWVEPQFSCTALGIYIMYHQMAQ